MPTPDKHALRALREEMFSAVMADDLPRVRDLVERGAPVHATRGTKSLLARALELPRSDMARFLLEAGAHISAATHNSSVLTLVLQQGFHDLLPVLADKGCSFTEKVSPFATHNAVGLLAIKQDSQGLLALKQLGVSLVWAHGGAAAANNPHKPTVEVWISSRNKRGPLNERWWETLEMLLAEPPEHPAPLIAAASIGGENYGRSKSLASDEILFRFRRSAWCTQEAAAVLACWLAHQDQLEKATEVLETVAPSTWERVDAFAPYQRNPVGCLLSLFRKDTGKPRLTAQRLKRLKRFRALGCPVTTDVTGKPLWVWAATIAELPWEALQAVLPENFSAPLAPEEKSLSLHAHMQFWVGFPPVHFLARHAQPHLLQALLRHRPDLMGETDPKGCTPLFRTVLPVSRIPGITDRQTAVAPALLAFWAAGSDLGDLTPQGKNLVHVLADACSQGIEPKDPEDTFLTILRLRPDLFEQADASGRKALDMLLEQPPWRNLQVVNTFLEQRRLDALFSAPAATAAAPKQRF